MQQAVELCDREYLRAGHGGPRDVSALLRLREVAESPSAWLALPMKPLDLAAPSVRTALSATSENTRLLEGIGVGSLKLALVAEERQLQSVGDFRATRQARQRAGQGALDPVTALVILRVGLEALAGGEVLLLRIAHRHSVGLHLLSVAGAGGVPAWASGGQQDDHPGRRGGEDADADRKSPAERL